MTLAQYRRGEQVCQSLNSVHPVAPSTRSQIESIQLRLRRTRIQGGTQVEIDGAFDPDLGDAIVLAEATLAGLRAQPPGKERRATLRYALVAPIPARVGHRDLPDRAQHSIADVGLGGVRLVAPVTAKANLRWADPLEIVVGQSPSAQSYGIEGMTVYGVIARIGADHTGLTFNVRFDRSDGDWSQLDGWVQALAQAAFVRES